MRIHVSASCGAESESLASFGTSCCGQIVQRLLHCGSHPSVILVVNDRELALAFHRRGNVRWPLARLVTANSAGRETCRTRLYPVPILAHWINKTLSRVRNTGHGFGGRGTPVSRPDSLGTRPVARSLYSAGDGSVPRRLRDSRPDALAWQQDGAVFVEGELEHSC